ncbi:hypothetical protein VNO77_14882 [Canavalia gladiata]|uniref:Uncharacterized protein n=1 Tax=Canavalia gladiata TaxID=3824 RepID=A0AAN9QQY8_CANGL
MLLSFKFHLDSKRNCRIISILLCFGDSSIAFFYLLSTQGVSQPLPPILLLFYQPLVCQKFPEILDLFLLLSKSSSSLRERKRSSLLQELVSLKTNTVQISAPWGKVLLLRLCLERLLKLGLRFRLIRLYMQEFCLKRKKERRLDDLGGDNNEKLPDFINLEWTPGFVENFRSSHKEPTQFLEAWGKREQQGGLLLWVWHSP